MDYLRQQRKVVKKQFEAEGITRILEDSKAVHSLMNPHILSQALVMLGKGKDVDTKSLALSSTSRARAMIFEATQFIEAKYPGAIIDEKNNIKVSTANLGNKQSVNPDEDKISQ